MTEAPITRCGFVALIGPPNSGKSTLINSLVGDKVSIVSRKVQTTRNLVRGIAMSGAAQIIVVDTPGIFQPKRRLDQAMVGSAWDGVGDADIAGLVVDARHAGSPEAQAIVQRLTQSQRVKVLILNKIDLVERSGLLCVSEALNQQTEFAATFMVSALKNDGIDAMRARLGQMMNVSPWLYPEDQISDAPIRSLAAEITREKLFERLHDELPYFATVETEQWKELADGTARVEQTIYVSRPAYKKIVIGEKGKMIKSVGQAARKEIADAAGHAVHLFLFVKVRENWTEDPERFREMGLTFPN
jgi:GTP-binding protein Era